MKKALKVSLLVVGALVALYLLYPSCVISEERETSLGMVSCSSSIKDLALKGKVSKSDLPPSCANIVSTVDPIPGGGMRLTNAKFGIELFLRPNPDARKPWLCSGTPDKFIPVFCRKGYKP